jgi:hypothetical protein
MKIIPYINIISGICIVVLSPILCLIIGILIIPLIIPIAVLDKFKEVMKDYPSDCYRLINQGFRTSKLGFDRLKK